MGLFWQLFIIVGVALGLHLLENVVARWQLYTCDGLYADQRMVEHMVSGYIASSGTVIFCYYIFWQPFVVPAYSWFENAHIIFCAGYLLYHVSKLLNMDNLPKLMWLYNVVLIMLYAVSLLEDSYCFFLEISGISSYIAASRGIMWIRHDLKSSNATIPPAWYHYLFVLIEFFPGVLFLIHILFFSFTPHVNGAASQLITVSGLLLVSISLYWLFRAHRQN